VRHEAILALIKALKDKDNQTNLQNFTVSIQQVVALALGRFSAGSDEAVPALTEVLEGSSDERTRMTAARALGEVGPEAKSAAPKLRALLKDENQWMREQAEEALKKIEGEARPAP
jgi:HEAT repeat protein